MSRVILAGLLTISFASSITATVLDERRILEARPKAVTVSGLQSIPADLAAIDAEFMALILFFQRSALPSQDPVVRDRAIETVLAALEAFIARHPDSDLVDDALLLIASAVGYRDPAVEYRAALRRVIDDAPGGTFHRRTLDTQYFRDARNGYIGNDGFGDWDRTRLGETDAYAQSAFAWNFNRPISLPEAYDPERALIEYQKALDRYPTSVFAPEAQFTIGEIHDVLGDRPASVAAFEKTIADYPNHGFYDLAAYDAAAELLVKTGDFDAIGDLGIRFRDRYGRSEDYLAESVIKLSYRMFSRARMWPDPSDLTVLISAADGYTVTAEDSAVVIETLRTYNEALPGRLSLRLIEDRSLGSNPYNDVDIEYIFDPASSLSFARQGGNAVYFTRVLVVMQTFQAYEEKLKTSVHEFGHALGLGHSFDANDMLFYSTGEVEEPRLSDRDIRTLERIYAQDANALWQLDLDSVIPPAATGLMSQFHIGFSNVSLKPLNIVSAAFEGGDASAFELLEFPRRYEARDEGLIVRIRFAPTNAGPASADLVLTHDGVGGSLRVTVEAEGFDAGIPLFIALPMEFDVLAVGQVDSSGMGLRNLGNRPLTYTFRLPLGEQSAFEIVESTVILTEDFGGSARINFAPSMPGLFVEPLIIEHDGPGGPWLQTLVGLATNDLFTHVTLSSDRLFFPQIPVGAERSGDIVITNSGTGPYRIERISVEGRHSADFVPVLEAAVIPPGESLTITIILRPQEMGPRSAKLIISPSEGEPLSINLQSNTGLIETPIIEFSATELKFPTVESGQSVQQSILVTNLGRDRLVITGVQVDGGDASEFGLPFVPFTVQSGESGSISFTYRPFSVGEHEARFILSAELLGEPVEIAARGSATEPMIIVGEGPGDNEWTSNGPPGGLVWHLTIDPLNASVVYAGTATGLYTTTNGGERWRVAKDVPQSTTTNIAVSPTNPEIAYVGNGLGLYKTLDRGQTWTRLETDLPVRSIGNIVIDPTDADIAYVSIYQSGFYKTEDGGPTWMDITGGVDVGSSAVQLAISPAAPGTVVAATQSGPFKSTNGGQTWSVISSGLPATIPTNLCIDPANADRIYLGGTDLYATSNGGSSWSKVTTGIEGAIWSIRVHPNNSDLVYIGASSGVYRSVNGGSTWTQVNGALDVKSLAVSTDDAVLVGTALHGVFSSRDGAAGWLQSSRGMTGSQALDIAFDVEGQALYAAVDGGGIYKSTDLGASWMAVNAGLPSGNASTVAVHPTDPQTLYAGIGQPPEIYVSSNGGDSWTGTGFETAGGRLGPSSIVIDRTNPSTLFAVVSEEGYRSSDGGTTWTKIYDRAAQGNMQVLAQDASDPRVLYAGTRDHERNNLVFPLKSADGGDTWSPMVEGIPEGQSSRPREVIAAAAIGESVFLGFRWQGVYRSSDNGSTWEEIASGNVSALAVHPDGRIIRGDFTGIQITEDAGATWTRLSNGYPGSEPKAIVVHPSDPSLIFAGTRSHGIQGIRIVPPRPQISVSVNSLTLDTARVGAVVNEVVTITNTGDANLMVNELSIEGGNGPFSVTSESFSLTPGASHQITVRYAPISPGTAEGRLLITHNAGNNSLKVDLVGQAILDPISLGGAAGPVAIDLDPATGDQGVRTVSGIAPGDTLTVDVAATSGATGASKFEARIGFVAEHLTWLDFTPSDVFANGFPVTSLSDSLVTIRVSLLDGVSNEDSGSLGQARFVVSGDFIGETTIDLLSSAFNLPVQIGSQGAQIRLEIADSAPNPDFDGDGSVGFGDFLQFAAGFGKTTGDDGYSGKFDLDGSGDIGFGDFLQFASAFGT